MLSFQETDDTIQGNRDGSLRQPSTNNFNYLSKQGGKLNQMIWTWSKCTSEWFVWLTIQRIQLDPVRSCASVRCPLDAELVIADIVGFQVGHIEVDCTDRERKIIFHGKLSLVLFMYSYFFGWMHRVVLTILFSSKYKQFAWIYCFFYIKQVYNGHKEHLWSIVAFIHSFVRLQ